MSVVFSVVVLLLYMLFRFRRTGRKQSTGFVRSFSKAGAPDQMEQTELDDFENSKMVSEGSQFGVQYFNQMMHDD